MVLGMFGGGSGGDLNQLLAKKNYGKAIEILKVQLAARKSDPRLRMQLADVLALAGGGKEAVSVLLPLADEYAREGFAAKAIAILKKVEKIDPGRRDVEKQLANLIKQGRPDSRPSLPLIRPGASMEIGMEEIGIGMASVSAPAAPSVPDFESEFAAPPEAKPAPAPEAPSKPRPVTEAALERLAKATPAPPAAAASGLDDLEDITVPMSEEDFRAGVLDVLGDALAASKEEAAAEAAEEAAAEAAAIARGETGPAGKPSGAVGTSPLFEEFTQDELVEVIHGLQLVSFSPGDIIITEGEPGSSLFVLTSGAAKAFVRNQAGKSVMVRELGEGDFFGEISILSGKPRTATVTAGTECDLLELDRATLDVIAETKPRVWDVLKDFAELRGGSARDKRLRGQT